MLLFEYRESLSYTHSVTFTVWRVTTTPYSTFITYTSKLQLSILPLTTFVPCLHCHRYPSEVEYLWVPCSFVQPMGDPTIEIVQEGVVTM